MVAALNVKTYGPVSNVAPGATAVSRSSRYSKPPAAQTSPTTSARATAIETNHGQVRCGEGCAVHTGPGVGSMPGVADVSSVLRTASVTRSV